MEISALASGSSGNCFYVRNNGSAVLVDAGISCKQIEERLKAIYRKPEKIKGIFITHEHSDHIRGVDVFSRRYEVPVFATKQVAKNHLGDKDYIKVIRNNTSVNIGGMEIEAFRKHHDAIDPVSYNIINDKKLSIMTDIGKCCEKVKKHVSDSDFLCMESNHDPGMLEDGPYPVFLKRRIKSNKGHLSNRKAALCILEHAKSDLKHIMLTHLSKNNNNPKTALKAFEILKERKDLNPGVTVSNRHRPTRLFEV